MKKTAIVTGCSRGIGREIALELSRDGYNIIGTYNTNKKDIEKLKSKIEAIGVKFDYYKLDLSDLNSIRDFHNNIKDTKIDVLINNAALSLDSSFESKTKEEFMKVLEVNLVGPFLLIQTLNNLTEDCVIINICSTDGINTYSKLNVDYSASKAGLINLSKSLSLIMPNRRIYALCPNWVNTESIKDMDPDYLKDEMKRIGQSKLIEPYEVAYKTINIIENNLKSGSVIVMEDSNYE